MCDFKKRGLDEFGYIQRNISVENVNPSFKPVLGETVASLVDKLGSSVHSIYLYGSVGRGNAIFGISDLDLSVIIHKPLTELQAADLTVLESEICSKYDSIAKLEFDVGTYDEAMVKNEYEWQFWIKHLCSCVWGVDLGDSIELYKPSLSIGIEMNKDIRNRLDSCLNQINFDNFQVIGKSIAKKILHTHYSLVSEEDNSFYSSMNQIADCLVKKDSSQAVSVRAALEMANGEIKDKNIVIELIQGYGEVVAGKLYELRASITYK